MRIEFLRNYERRIKAAFNRRKLHQLDFSIISNNCWGTFIYKKYNIPYQSPFVNLFIPGDDYIRLLKNFSPALLRQLDFIEHKSSRHISFLKERDLFNRGYPIGLIGDEIEIHFLHYDSKEDVRQKWESRVNRINYKKLLFKFSDCDGVPDELIRQFDALPFKNKICFTAKPFPELKSVVYLPHFHDKAWVTDEWKHSERQYNLPKLLNTL